ncbi:phytoene desaturase [Yimella sp. cx-573]|nr:phytoene desaturase [Yimella sp. cx-573]
MNIEHTAPDEQQSVVVIGGGIAGLATAALLAAHGFSVDLLEKNDDVGGRVGSYERDGFRFDTGASWWLMPEVFEHFFELLGTTVDAELDLVTLDPSYRVFFQDTDQAVDVRPDVAHNTELFETIEPGAGRTLGAYLESAKDTYDIALRRFLYSNFDSTASFLGLDVLRRSPKLSLLLTRSLGSHIAGRFKDVRLRQILGYPAVFLGSSPDRAPSMYHLMSHLDLGGQVLYPLGGFTRLIEAVQRLAVQHGVRVHTGAQVTAIRTEGKPAQARGVDYLRGGASHSINADIVVAATDLHHVETTLLSASEQSHPEKSWERRDPGFGAVLALLGVSGRVPELPHHSLFFTTDWKRNFEQIFGKDAQVPEPASIYVCTPSRTDSSVAPEGEENLFVLIPVPADVEIGHGGDDGAGSPVIERAVDAAIDQIATWADVPDLRERIVVRRTIGPADFADDFNAWQGSALGLEHTLRQSAFLRPSNVSSKVEGLYYAGSSTVPGVGLPMCLISAELVLKRLTGDNSSTPLDSASTLSTG